MRTPILLCFTALAASGCSDRSLDDDVPRDVDAPEVQVLAPQRGAVLEGRTVTVRGIATDVGTGIKEVTVNGTRADVGDSGRFEVTLDVPAGTTLVHTKATDGDGNETRDTRGVLAGPFVPQEQPVSEAFIARISDTNLSALGELAGNFAEREDLGAIAQSINPVLKHGGDCLGIRVNVEKIDKSSVDFVLTSQEGGIAFELDVNDLDIGSVADFDVACIGGDSDIDIRADQFRLAGEILISLDHGDLSFVVVATESSFDGLEIDFGFVPDALTGVVTNALDGMLMEILIEALQDMVPPLVESYFDGFMTASWTLMVFGREVQLGLRPTELDFTARGGFIATDTSIFVSGVDSPGYVATPEPRPDLPSDAGFAVAVADDALNQVLTSFWASKALDISFKPSSSDATRLADLVDRLDVTMLMPPVVSADRAGSPDGTVDLRLGDVLIDVVDEESYGDSVVTRVALSAELQLTVSTDDAGRVTVEAMTPTLWVDVLDDGVTGSNPLNDAQVEALASAVGARLPGLIDNALRAVPIPTFAGATISEPMFTAMDGYFLISGDLILAQ